MRRRRLVLAAAALAALPLLVAAPSPGRPARIGWLTAQRPASLVPFVQAGASDAPTCAECSMTSG